MRCLIVDDNDSFLEVSRALLEGEGVVVGMATTTVECIDRARELEPDVILVDIDLGEESGLELTRRLAGEQDTAGTQLILISAHDEDEFAELIEESAAVGFLAKTALSKQAIEAVLATCNRAPSAPRGRRSRPARGGGRPR
jgi:two-component system, NarL family, nitrate/nitrite response regulator NarL